MTRWIPTAAALACAAALMGCAATPPADAQQAAASEPRCVAVTGTHVCRKEGSGNPSNVKSIPAETLQRQGDDLVRPPSGRTGS